MSSQVKRYLPLVVIGILLLIAIAYFLNSQSSSTDPSEAFNAGSQEIITTPAEAGLDVVTKTGPGYVEVWLQPIEDVQDVSSMALRTTLSAPGIAATNPTPTLGDTFDPTTWTVAFINTETNQPGEFDLNLAMLYIPPEAFTISEEVLLARVETNTDIGSNIITTIDPEVSKFFDSTGQDYSFQLFDESN